ncbi:MAG: GIY-YIG nuclease family protein [Lachnospiraceae bacterium]|nr:GIY-YIG nuclease family protein [Lachnospiraceae bacterium]
MREEAAERKALENERKKIEQEESKYEAEIQKLKEQMENAAHEEMDALNKRILELQEQLSDVVIKKEDIVNLQNGRAGTVYIISNLGSFGDDVFKIGMTRRLEPQDRINELGSASVPFKFDVHSFIFSEDAVALEGKMHDMLNKNRVNKVNTRKEFFKISIDDLEKLVEDIDPTAEFNRTMVANEYRASLETEETYTENYFAEEELIDE